MDGRDVETMSRYVEAMEEDGRIARYEAQTGAFRLTGHYVVCNVSDQPSRKFVPCVA
jgi:hypothetical protein